jgi:glycosyltransferase involved in cell wall biosynthesis
MVELAGRQGIARENKGRAVSEHCQQIRQAPGRLEKVAIITSSLTGGSPANVVLDLSAGMAMLGAQVDLLALRGRTHPTARPLHPRVREHELGAGRARYVLPGLVRYLWRSRPDVLIANGWLFNSQAIVAGRVARGTPVVVREAATLSYSANVEHGDHLLLGNLDHVARLLYRHAAAVVTNSEAVRRDLLDEVGIEVPPRRVRAIPNPVDIECVRALARAGQVPAQLQSAPRPWIVTVGRLVKEKNHGLLLQAFARFLETGQPGTLFIIGDGDRRAEVEHLIGAHRLHAHVHLLGEQPNPFPFVEAADAFILTSEQEGFGLVLVEAMALGTPVVCGACLGGAREVLGSPPAGIWVDPPTADDIAAAMLSVLQKRELATALRRRGLARAEAFRPDRIAAEWLRFLGDMGVLPRA